VLDEVAASAIPLIATPTGVVEELGPAVVAVKRDPKQIAQALTEVAANPTRRAAKGTRGPSRAAQFAWDSSIDALLAVYEGLLARKR
jgi:glycosyltransferase involved in cell wall biosynthesis